MDLGGAHDHKADGSEVSHKFCMVEEFDMIWGSRSRFYDSNRS